MVQFKVQAQLFKSFESFLLTGQAEVWYWKTQTKFCYEKIEENPNCSGAKSMFDDYQTSHKRKLKTFSLKVQ